MYIFPDDEHLETRRVPNKPQPIVVKVPFATVIQTTVLSVAVSVPLAFTLLDIKPQFDINPNLPEQPSPGMGESASPLSSQNPVTPDQRRIDIPSQCNGFVAEGANFRDSPSLEPSAIKGAVRAGESVLLTGSERNGDGIIWYEAINESTLAFSAEPDAQNVTDPNQRGWIAKCFIP